MSSLILCVFVNMHTAIRYSFNTVTSPFLHSTLTQWNYKYKLTCTAQQSNTVSKSWYLSSSAIISISDLEPTQRLDDSMCSIYQYWPMTRPSFYSFSLHLTTNYIAKAYISIYEARARVTISGSRNFTQIALVHSSSGNQKEESK